MKRLHHHRHHPRSNPPLPPGGDQRRGTVLIVVMGLLGLLMLLGFAFYTFSRQEESNAEFFAAAERVGASAVETKNIFEWGLASLINGGPSDLPNSALWGGRHSLMANAFGRDIHPFSGRGTRVAVDQNGLQIIDQDFDLSTSESNTPFYFNDSPSAIADSSQVGLTFVDPGTAMGSEPELPDFRSMAAPDAGYTYPDLNNIFLAYNGYGIDSNGNPLRTIIPSFDRPQYLRENVGSVQPIPNDQRNRRTDTAQRIMRAHREHMHIAPDGTVLGYRYLRAASSGVEPFARYDGSTATDLFDFKGTVDPMDSNVGVQGVWEFTDATHGPGSIPYYSYDVDADGDGINEAVYLDLDYPVQTLSDGNDTRYIPLFAFTIYDADGLLNLLAHGNVEGFRNGQLARSPNPNTPLNVLVGKELNDPSNISRLEMLHRSNLGATTTETNPQWGLTAALPNPSDSNYSTEIAKLQQHAFYFDRDFDANASGIHATETEIANMEWFFARHGRIEYGSERSDVIDEFPGIYGEDQYLIATATGTGPFQDTTFPKPGRTFGDDNGNRVFGEPIAANNQYYNFRQPLDVLGSGRGYDITTAIGGRRTLTALPTGFDGRFPGFIDYQTTQGFAGWRTYFGGNLMGSVDVPIPNQLIDEAFELNVDHPTASPDDDILPISDMTYLQASTGDIDADNLTARAANLMPYNFVEHDEAEEIRKRFTTLSWDMKNFGIGFPEGTLSNTDRAWEFSINGDGDNEFPPYFNTAQAQRFDPTDRGDWNPLFPGSRYPSNEPFRLAIRLALRTVAGDKSRDPLPRQQRALALNGITCSYVGPNQPAIEDNRRVAYTRELTAHASDPGNNVISPVASGTDPGERPNTLTNANREAWARYDRQLLARDIYVMLYTLGGGSTIDVTTNSNAITSNGPDGVAGGGDDLREIYDDVQLNEMAQFAINFVDRLDPDNVIDKFEFDRDLSDGWDLDDDPFDVGETPEGTTDRGVVYGIENQELTIVEGLAFRTEEIDTNMDGLGDQDLLATRHEELYRFYWTYLDLLNAAPYSLNNLANRWQIELQVGPLSTPVDTRVFTFLDNPTGGAVGGAQSFTIMSAGSTEGSTGTGQKVDDSRFMADLDYDEAASAMANMGMAAAPPNSDMEVIVPATTPTSKIDLVTDTSRYELVLSDGTTSVGQFLDDVNFETGTPTLTFTLRRRLHLGRTVNTTDPQYDDDNPWIDVDVHQMTGYTEPSSIPATPANSRNGIGGVAALALDQNDKNGWNIKAKILKNSVISLERLDRLDRQDRRPHSEAIVASTGDSVQADLDHNGTPETYADAANFQNYKDAANNLFRLNSIGRANRQAEYNLWQMQSDRYYHSVSEILNIPLFGPEDVTLRTENATTSGTLLAGNTKILRPFDSNSYGANGADDNGGGDDDYSLNNYWYRLLEFLERPSPISREGEIRDPGMMNLNTIRYPASLAGLVDDPYAFSFTAYQDIKNNNLATQTSYMPDSYESGRDWWTQFLMSRDGGYNFIDTDGSGTVNAADSNPVRYDWTTGRILPGAPGAMPFRPMSLTTAGAEFSLEHTALRHLPKAWDSDPGTTVNNTFPTRRLFELRTDNEPGSNIDAYAPYRLYSKILNNATVRSNTFFVFMQIDYFEVLEIDGGDVDPDSGTTVPAGYVLQKIGRQLDPNAAATPKSQRGFFVIDRSKAFGKLTEENFDGGTNPTFAFWGDRATSDNPVEFDYKSLVVHQHVFQN